MAGGFPLKQVYALTGSPANANNAGRVDLPERIRDNKKARLGSAGLVICE
jgi:hypothetical protein